MFDISQISDKLLIGSEDGARSREELLKRNVKLIVNATQEDEVPNFYPKDFRYIRVPVQDMPRTPLNEHFEDICRQICSVQDGAVLIHCSYGKSRSATLAMAYMMRHFRMKLSDAYRTMTTIRPVVNPNVGFISQLIDFERNEFGVATLELEEYCIRELQKMYEESNTQATRKNCIKALKERPFSSDMGIVEAMVWLEDNCTDKE